jgi:tyrosinase
MLSYSKWLSTLGAMFLSTMFLTACAGDDETKEDETTPPPADMRVRKNVKALTAEERADFVDAILKLKTVPSPYDSNFNYYDQFVQWHYLSSLCHNAGEHHPTSHMNLSFLAWHRMLIYRFEQALREVSGKEITVPYWDWTDPTSTDVVFAEDFMGGEGDPNDFYTVKSGPFKDWKFEILPKLPAGAEGAHKPFLVRKFNTDFDGMPPAEIRLATPDEVNEVLKITQFNAAPYDVTVDPAQSFQLALEGWRGFTSMECDTSTNEMFPKPKTMKDPITMMDVNLSSTVLHATVHPWVAGIQSPSSFPPSSSFVKGSMAWSTSPNDPAFFLNHANVDRIWLQWQNMHGKGKDSYAPVTDGPHGTNLGDTMLPFPTFKDGLNKIEDLFDENKLLIAYE